MNTTPGNEPDADRTTELTRDQLPDDTIEILEALAADLNIARGRTFLRVEYRDGRLQQGEKVEILTRSALVAHDAARLAG